MNLQARSYKSEDEPVGLDLLSYKSQADSLSNNAQEIIKNGKKSALTQRLIKYSNRQCEEGLEKIHPNFYSTIISDGLDYGQKDIFYTNLGLNNGEGIIIASLLERMAINFLLLVNNGQTEENLAKAYEHIEGALNIHSTEEKTELSDKILDRILKCTLRNKNISDN